MSKNNWYVNNFGICGTCLNLEWYDGVYEREYFCDLKTKTLKDAKENNFCSEYEEAIKIELEENTNEKD